MTSPRPSASDAFVTSYDKAEKHNMAGDNAAVDDGALDSVFASNRDRGGKSAPPEPMPEKETVSKEPEAQKAEGEAEQAQGRDPLKQYRDPETGRLVPLSELKSEREKRQEQARLREDAEKRAKEYEDRVKELERKLQAAPQPQVQYQQPVQQAQQPAPQRPDVWTDPEGALAFERQQILAQQQFQVFETRLALSEEMMSQKADYAEMKNLFHQAATEALARGDASLRNQLVAHPMPAKFAYEKGKEIAAMREVGTDINAYRQRIEEEVRAKVLEELKSGTAANAQPQKYPGTLADAPASGAQGAHLTDEAVMGAVFSTNRRRTK